MPPIAIITVTFSPGTYLAAFLDSVEASTKQALVIMADNGSTDGVAEAAAATRENAEFLATGKNLGYGGGVNFAVRDLLDRYRAGKIDTDFFIIANPDVVFALDAVAELIHCAKTNPHAGAVGPQILDPDGSVYPSARAIPTLGNGIGHALLGQIWKDNPWSQAYRQNENMDHQHTAGWLSGACLLVRWEAFLQVGGFDERYFMYMEDVDLGDRLNRAGYQNIYCPTAKVIHAKSHATSKHPEIIVPAHHQSAYRFQADRLTAPWQAPIRLILRVGLSLRQRIVSLLSRNRKA